MVRTVQKVIEGNKVVEASKVCMPNLTLTL